MRLYCIQCLDNVSGKVGTFGYDVARTDGFYAITPVFSSLQYLCDWYREQGFVNEQGHADAKMACDIRR